MKATIIYDGSCKICVGNLRWLYRLDWLKKFDALPYQSEDVYRQFPKLRREDCEKAMHLVFPNGHVYIGADALRKIFLRIPVTFAIGVLMAIPPIPWVLRKLYFCLVPYRYCFGGRCHLE